MQRHRNIQPIMFKDVKLVESILVIISGNEFGHFLFSLGNLNNIAE